MMVSLHLVDGRHRACVCVSARWFGRGYGDSDDTKGVVVVNNALDRQLIKDDSCVTWECLKLVPWAWFTLFMQTNK